MGGPSYTGRGCRRFRWLRRRRADLRHVPQGGARLLHHPRRWSQEPWQGPGRAGGRACCFCYRLQDGRCARPDQVRDHHQRQEELHCREARLREVTSAMSRNPTPPKTTTKPKTTSKATTKTVTMQDRIVELRPRREEVIAGGGEKRHAKQHAAGKLTARERIAEMVDPLSFEESGLLAQHRTTLFGMDTAVMPADGVVTGAAS